MKTELTDEQIAVYRKNGFVIIEDWLTPDELAQWRAMVDDSVGQRSTRLPGRSGPPPSSGDYYSNVFTQRVNLWQTHEGMRKLIVDPRIGALAAQLEGLDGLRIWHDQALIKEPWANPTPWHLDGAYWSFHDRHAITIWIALDDVTVQNGCMYFLPGTHKQADFTTVPFGPNMKGLFEHYPQWAQIEPVPVQMPAGSCSFHNGLMPHAAGPNMTARHRRAMTCIFMPDGATFNGQKNILTDKQLQTLQVGDVLDDKTTNPLVYQGG